MIGDSSQREITILAARYWPETHGGVEQHMWEFSRALAEAGVGVNVLTENRTQAPLRQAIMPGLTVDRRGPIDVGRLWRWRPLVHLHWWTRWLRSYRCSGPVWASNPTLAAAAIRAGHSQRTIFNPAGCVAAMRHIGRLHPHAATMQLPRTVAWMDRFAYRRARRVVVSSHNVASQFARAWGRRDDVHVLPLGAERPADPPARAAARRQWDIDPGAFVIGFVGRLDPCKGLDFLFDAVSQTAPGPNTVLLIAGDGPDEARLRRRAQNAGLAGNIVWAGRVDAPASAYAAMDVLVLPSIYEGFGLVLLEAMAAGVPVLGRKGDGKTILTACEEIIAEGRTGFLFDSHDPAHLTQRLRQLESQPRLRRALGSAGRAAARDKTWRCYTRQCMNVLTSDWNGEPSHGYPHRHARRAA